MAEPAPRKRIFVSYSHRDEKLASEVLEQLGLVEQEGLAEIFSDRRLEAGDREGQLTEFIESADIFVVLVSPDYLASETARAEMERALERAGSGRALLLPVLIRDAPWQQTRLAQYQFFPRDLRPLARRRDRVRVLAELVTIVRDAIVPEPARGMPEPAEPRPPQHDAPPEETRDPAGTDLEVSPSVRHVTQEVGGQAVSAVTIVSALLDAHPEYGNRTGGRLALADAPPDAPRDTAEEWLVRVRTLFRMDAAPVLHGRLVIRGLTLLEPELTKQLLDHGFLAALEDELKPPLAAVLSPEGRRRWEPDQVPAQADRPAQEDRLGRTDFAASLAVMIEEERRPAQEGKRDPESFLVHLHGPWGSGKTSLLGFLADALRDSDSRWVIVQFNAWQQERLSTPWWSLMTAVRHEGLRMPFTGKGRARDRLSDLARSARLIWLDLWWRVRLGWMAYLLLPLVLGGLWLAWRHGFFKTAAGDTGWLTQLGDIAKPVAALVGLVVALLGAARSLGRSLAVGSSRGAETFMRTSRDPMRKLRRRYERLIATIGRPVAVFIDDLDRCQSSYVVEVLQGVQTLLIDAPVTYVVAADRRWLYDSYAKVYADFRSVSRAPGRPLGHLFLEKTFQLSAVLPQLPPDVRDEYWRWLLDPRRPDGTNGDDKADAEARRRADSLGLDEVVAAATGNGEDRSLREALTSRASAPDVRQEIESRLQPFSGLLDPNPRAMKRLINAYRIELARLLAEGRRAGRAGVTPEQLALWTIVSLRWPLLADELALRPHLLTSGDRDPELRADLQRLLASTEVQAVIGGDGVSARLTDYAVCAISGRALPRSDQPSHPTEAEGSLA